MRKPYQIFILCEAALDSRALRVRVKRHGCLRAGKSVYVPLRLVPRVRRACMAETPEGARQAIRETVLAHLSQLEPRLVGLRELLKTIGAEEGDK